MKKTQVNIERDFYVMVQNSTLGAEIRGSIYRSEMRPVDATTEDLVIKLLSGLDDQVQTGVIIFNLYVPNITMNGKHVPDYKRIGDLQTLINEFVETAGDTEYWLTSEATPVMMTNEDIDQHFIYARITYKRITE